MNTRYKFIFLLPVAFLLCIFVSLSSCKDSSEGEWEPINKCSIEYSRWEWLLSNCEESGSFDADYSTEGTCCFDGHDLWELCDSCLVSCFSTSGGDDCSEEFKNCIENCGEIEVNT